jgi:hypothetical protein
VAVTDGVLMRNVAALVEGPRTGESRLDDAITAKQAGLVVKAAKGERLEALAVVILTSGLRRGEALVGPVAVALKEHRRRQASERLRARSEWQDEGWVFTTPIGTAVDPRNVLRWWHGITEKAGVGKRQLDAGRMIEARTQPSSQDHRTVSTIRRSSHPIRDRRFSARLPAGRSPGARDR